MLADLQDDCSVSDVAFAERDAIHCHFTDAMEVNQSGDDDQNVKYLM